MYNNIDSERIRLRMTVEDLCKEIEISKRTYFSWQQSGKIPANKLIQMADLFKCSIDYLLGRSENRKSA